MLTAGDNKIDTLSQISSTSSKPDDFFITGAKTKNKRGNSKKKDIDSPTAKAA